MEPEKYVLWDASGLQMLFWRGLYLSHMGLEERCALSCDSGSRRSWGLASCSGSQGVAAVLRLVRECSEVREFMVTFWRNCLLMTGAWFQIQDNAPVRGEQSEQTAECQRASQYVRVWTCFIAQSCGLGLTMAQVKEFWGAVM